MGKPETPFTAFTGPYAHYKPYLRPIIEEEMSRANLYTTIHTIYLRVSQHINECLGISRYDKILENRVFIDPEIATAIDDLWLEFLSRDVVLSAEDHTAYEKFKANDYLRAIDITKLVRSLLTRCVSSRDPNNGEKVLTNDKLCVIFAMDGFKGCYPTDVKNYIENLSVGSICRKNNDYHVKGVRDMYKMFSGDVSGTDACQLVWLSLLQLYRDNTNDAQMKAVVDEKANHIRDNLVKNAQTFPALNELAKPEFLKKLSDIYKNAEVVVEKMAAVKLSMLYNKGKRTHQRKQCKGKKRARNE